MDAFRRMGRARGGGLLCAAVMASSCVAWAGTRKPVERQDPWQAAVAARAAFEAEAAGTHTRAEYTRLMEEFRAIYHGDPGDAHAGRAAEQVAELLAEEGRELGDKKSLHDAGAQYEWVAKAYPGGSLAPHALGEAVVLFGAEGAGDEAAARRAAGELKASYPHSAEARELAARQPVVVADGQAAPVKSSGEHYRKPLPPANVTPIPTPDGGVVDGQPAPLVRGSGEHYRKPLPPADVTPIPVETRTDAGAGLASAQIGGGRSAGLSAASAKNVDSGRDDSSPLGGSLQGGSVQGASLQSGKMAMVTGIRHWSTSTYTRVAIDLGDEVEYQAARVENPDRIFFDLHHAKLAPQLAGKSFSVTDDGFLTRIRAAQFSGDVTRVVLDVHEVAEYTAFLLPNPYRLIIDIHGKPAGAQVAAAGGRDETARVEQQGNAAADAGSVGQGAGGVAVPLAPSAGTQGRDEVSGLPPMPVTDGSGNFGLPPKRIAAGGDAGAGGAAASNTTATARPRVVISSKPTTAKPVPNAVATKSSETGTEVAAVSEQPGKVVATSQPTSQPIVARSGDDNAAAVSSTTKTKRKGAGAHVAGAPVEAAPPTADGETSLVRALGLKIGRIVIDAGHGGHDSGTLGVGGIEEKDVVLDVALRLGKLLHDRLGAEIVYTRADDTFIPLETRTAIANKAQADLFISVHANSSQDASARGVEVYYLNFTSDPEAMTVASRENAVSTQSVHELSDLVKKIALKDKIDESRELAADVDQSLYAGLTKGNAGLKDRGVKKAPFVVLIGANMPSILAEISFVTNPDDADELGRPAYRERVAESLYKGVARYAAGINAGKGTGAVATERAAR
jgi:N-acetylmuramoyl-L-alanine amidase